LTPWRKPRTVHDPGKVVLDVALAVALDGDCLADVGMLRAEPAVFGPLASDPTVSRLIGTLTASGKRADRPTAGGALLPGVPSSTTSPPAPTRSGSRCSKSPRPTCPTPTPPTFLAPLCEAIGEELDHGLATRRYALSGDRRALHGTVL
jgi:hypothetical protein